MKISDTMTRVLWFIAILAIIEILIALPVMLLWNWLIPGISGLRQISFLEALGISVLSTLLFRGGGGSNENTK